MNFSNGFIFNTIKRNELKSEPWITMNKIEKFLGLENKITENDFVRGSRGYYCIKRQDTNLADKELMVRK